MASKEVKYGFKTYRISYEMTNLDREDAAVFLHGWGANKEIMKKAFGAILPNFKHVYIDMPGFGNSDIFSPLHTKDYAKIMQSFFDEIKISPKIIVGHSFGGKVATLIKPEILVLLSSAGIVVKKPLSVRLKIAIFKIFKALGFGFLYKIFATKDVKGMSKTMYETLKNVVDEDFSSKFADFKGKAFVFWGADDKTTPLRCGERINYLIKNSELHPLKGDHFFFLLHAKYINGVITSWLKEASSCDSAETQDEYAKDFVVEKGYALEVSMQPQEANLETSALFINAEKIQEPMLFENAAQEKSEPKTRKKESKTYKIHKQQVLDL